MGAPTCLHVKRPIQYKPKHKPTSIPGPNTGLEGQEKSPLLTDSRKYATRHYYSYLQAFEEQTSICTLTETRAEISGYQKE